MKGIGRRKNFSKISSQPDLPYQIAKMLTFEKSYLPLQSRLAPILGTDSQKVRFVVIPCGDVGSKLTFGQSNR